MNKMFESHYISNLSSQIKIGPQERVRYENPTYHPCQKAIGLEATKMQQLL